MCIREYHYKIYKSFIELFFIYRTGQGYDDQSIDRKCNYHTHFTVFTANTINLQGHSHQNLSGQVDISQASIYSDFHIIVIVVHGMHSILQGCRNWLGRHAAPGPKFPVATSR